MSELFLKVVNMSISAGWLVLAVLVCRLVLKKAPKWVNVVLWGIVAVRLLLPFSIESAVSLIPSAETISPDIMMDATPTIHTGISAINSAVNPVISQSFAPLPGDSANPLQIWIPVFAIVWLAGVAVLFAYTAVSYWCLRKKVCTAVLLRDNIFQSENVASPFVLGVIRPRIYLPFIMDERDMENVAAHERAHIKRHDHWWKPLGFLLLTVHWFNPLMWLAYVLLCRDIELACDEKVIRELGNEQRADYTQALLACSVSRRTIAACPLAFGEVGVKERVKSVMNYKKPAFWAVVLAVIACAVVAVCFLTDPAASDFDMRGRNVSDLDPQKIVSGVIKARHLKKGTSIHTNSFSTTLMLTSDFDWVDGDAIRFFYYERQTTYSSQLRFSPYEGKIYVEDPSEWGEQDKVYLLRHLLQALKYLPQEEIGEMAQGADRYMLGMDEYGTPDDYDRVITYTENGAEPIDGWYIHLELMPMRSTTPNNYHGAGGEAIHLFYGKKDPKASLSLDDVIALSQKGYELTWSDFERFDHVDTGSGLYIWKFEISQIFTLMVGGGSTNGSPMYIYLIANDGLNTRIDIRDGGVEEYIALHKDNPVVIQCTAGWQCGYAGYSEELFAKMVELGGVSKRLQVSSIQFLPVVRVDSTEKLREITEVLSSYVSLDYSPHPDIPSISDVMWAYDDSFFETSTLFLIYTTAPMTGVRYSDEYVTVSDGTLSIGVQRQWPEAGDYSMEGWLLAVSLPTGQITGAETVEARISSQYYPDGWGWRTLMREEG